jgi:hypothetical protein
VQVDIPSEDEMPLGIEVSINEDAFDLDELSEDEQEEVAEDAAVSDASDISTFQSALHEVRTYIVLLRGTVFFVGTLAFLCYLTYT